MADDLAVARAPACHEVLDPPGGPGCGRDRGEELGPGGRLILELATDGIYEVDHEGRIVYANSACCTLLGRTIDELVGQPAHATIHHSRVDGICYPIDDCPIYAARCSGRMRHGRGEVFWRKDGSSLSVSYTCAPVRNGQDIVGAVCIFAPDPAAIAPDRLPADELALQRTRRAQRWRSAPSRGRRR